MTDHKKGERVSKNNYVRTKVCRKIYKQIYMPKNTGEKPKEILDFLKNLYDQNCNKSSQNSMDSNSSLSM